MSAVLTTPARAQGTHALIPSQVSTFTDCAYRWYCGKVLQLPDPPNGGLALGRAIHRTAAAVLRLRAQGQDLPTKECTVQHFEQSLGLELQEAALAPDEDAKQLSECGAAMIALWLGRVAPEISPAAVEVELCGAIAGVEVHAIADVITVDGMVIDFKTASKKPSSLSPDHALQLTTYAMLADKPAARLVTIKKTQQPAIVQHTIDVAPWKHYAETMYSGAAEAMRSEIYLPHRNSNLCSRKHCAFWRQCEAEHGGEVRS